MDPTWQEVATDVHIVPGPTVDNFGFRFRARSVVVKLHDGSLWMGEPVELPQSLVTEISELGPVKYVVAQTPFHVWRLEGGHHLFPDAELWSCPQVARGFRHLPIRIIGEEKAGWENDFEFLLFEGSPFIKEVVFFHKASHTVIIGDLIQSHRPFEGAPMSSFLAKILGVAAPNAAVALDIRLSFIRRDLARRSLQRLLAWDFDKIILAHDRCIDHDAKGFVRQAFRWLQR